MLSFCYQIAPPCVANALFMRVLRFLYLFELGVSFAIINYICLSFMQIHATFYFNYINYSGLLIFCCQNVAAKISLSETFRVLFVISFHFLISSNFPYIHQRFLHLSIYLHNYYIWDYYNSLA